MLLTWRHFMEEHYSACRVCVGSLHRVHWKPVCVLFPFSSAVVRRRWEAVMFLEI